MHIRGFTGCCLALFFLLSPITGEGKEAGMERTELNQPALNPSTLRLRAETTVQVAKKVQKLPRAKSVYTVAYFEAGPYWEFTALFKALYEELQAHSEARLLSFPERYRYSPGWDLPDADYDAIAQRVMSDPEIDMVLAMGTVPSKALLRHNNNEKPVFCIDVADPAGSGLIIPHTSQPVAPNFFVEYVPSRWSRSIALMAMLQRFEKIGAMSPDTPEGRTYSNLRELREVGRERGFEVITYERLDSRESVATCKEGLEYLIRQGIDSMYIPALNCFDPEQGDPRMLYELLHKHKVKTYAKDGKIPVANGALIGISTLNYHEQGKFFASLLLQHVSDNAGQNGAVLPFEPKIYLNVATARRLGISFPIPLLINVDGIYDSTLPPLTVRP